MQPSTKFGRDMPGMFLTRIWIGKQNECRNPSSLIIVKVLLEMEDSEVEGGNGGGRGAERRGGEGSWGGGGRVRGEGGGGAGS